MKRPLPLLATLIMLLSIAGCSTKDNLTEVKVQPSRMTQANFTAMSISQVKNNIMAACSSKRLVILTTKDEVTCTQNEFSNERKREIERIVNDEFATKIQIVTQFKLVELGANVNVTANIYAQYLAPVSVTSGLQPRTRNLLDDVSFDEMSALLGQVATGEKK